MSDNGSFEVRDFAGLSTAGFGAGLTLTPSFILQIAGCFIAILSLFYAHKRYSESKRANDIAQDRLNWEKEKDAYIKIQKTETNFEQEE